MEALLVSALTVFFAELGDRTQLLAAALAIRFRNERSIIGGLALASLINCFASAYAGIYMGKLMSELPLRMFQGLAYIFAAVGMLWWRRKVNLLGWWKTGAFMTAFLGLFILEFGDKSQFLILAKAANNPWGFAAAGGWIGIMAACVPAIIMGEKLADMLPIAAMRRIAGFAFLLWGIGLVLSAWGLIG